MFNCFSNYKDEMTDEDELTDSMIGMDTANRSGKGIKWTKNEDNLLKQLVEQYGEKWELISSELKDRSDIQCQQRWTKVVNPDLIKGPWTKEVRNR
jgi:transcriptional activator Myb